MQVLINKSKNTTNFKCTGIYYYFCLMLDNKLIIKQWNGKINHRWINKEWNKLLPFKLIKGKTIK